MFGQILKGKFMKPEDQNSTEMDTDHLRILAIQGLHAPWRRQEDKQNIEAKK